MDDNDNAIQDRKLEELYEIISDSESSPPLRRHQVLHNPFSVRYRKNSRDYEWREVAAIFRKAQPNELKLPKEWIEQVRIHSRTIAREGGLSLIEAAWDTFAIEEKTESLSGISNCFRDSGAVRWAEKHLNEAKFDIVCALEFGCNAIYFKQVDLFERIVRMASIFHDQQVTRFDGSKSEDKSWQETLGALPTRFIDIWLEAAVRGKNRAAMLRCLECGANPNISIWTLERSYNEKESLLCQVVKDISSYDGEIGSEDHNFVISLLDKGADPVGSDFEGKNRALYFALRACDWKLVDKMLDLGASFSGGNLGDPVKTAGSESETISPPPGLFLQKKDVEWVTESFKDLIDFESIDSVPYFFQPNAQVGYYTSFIGSLISGDLVEELARYEERGLLSSFTIATFLSAIDSGAYHCVKYLLEKYSSDPAQAFRRIIEHRPGFATSGKQFMCRPEPNGSNVIDSFNSYNQPPITMPDGTRFFVDIDSIAPANHDHGCIQNGRIFVRKIECEYAREAEFLVTTKIQKTWRNEAMPGTTSKARYHEIERLLPVVKECNDQFIWIGVNLDRLAWTKLPKSWKAAVSDWSKGAEGAKLRAIVEERIFEQDRANRRAPSPRLSDGELDGYPAEFWPYLDRLDDGTIGVTGDSGASRPDVKDLYEVWARQNKPVLDAMQT